MAANGQNGSGNGKTPRKTPGNLRVGNPGNKGGTGRPPSLIRQRCRGAFDRRIKLLIEIAEGEALEVVRDATGRETQLLKSASVAERLKAIDLLGKYGLGTTVTETDTEGQDVHRPGRLTPEQRSETIARVLAETRN